jgi:hypothetical protein
MRSFLAAAAAAVVAAQCAAVVAAQWDTVCPGASGGPYSAYNATSCPSANSTCAPSPFSQSGVGCCPMPDAVSCSNFGNPYVCCPQGTVRCVAVNGSSWSEVSQCVDAANTTLGFATSVCKPGPPLPMSTTLKNVLVIGDSVSIGYTPYVAANISDIALVQHAPWGGDGGAEETAYGLQCLDFFLHSPGGYTIHPDVIWFNWGLHDGPLGNNTIPGQQGPATLYLSQLETLATTISAWAQARGIKLIFALTSPMLCDANADGCVVTGNNGAEQIMKGLNIPTVNLHDAIVNKCGPVPQSSCFGENGCFCPHCPPGYSWLAETVVAPAIRQLLLAE